MLWLNLWISTMGRVVHQRASSVPKENLGPKAAGLGYAEASKGSLGVGQREASRGKLQLAGALPVELSYRKATETLFLVEETPHYSTVV